MVGGPVSGSPQGSGLVDCAALLVDSQAFDGAYWIMWKRWKKDHTFLLFINAEMFESKMPPGAPCLNI